MLNPCYRCNNAVRGKDGYVCKHDIPAWVDDSFPVQCPSFDPINKTEPGANCDLYGKACMTCSGCPAEPPTEEEESEVWG